MTSRAFRMRTVMVRILIKVQRRMERARIPVFIACGVLVAACTALGMRYDPDSRQQVIAYRVVLVADLAAIYSYVGIYTLLQPWWKSKIGRSIVLKDLVLSVPMLVIAGSLFFSFGRLGSKVASGLDLGALAAIAAILFARSEVWIAEHARKAGHIADEADRVAELEAEVARLRGLLGQ